MKGMHSIFAMLSGMALLEEKTPQSYQAALASEDVAEWQRAMQSEYDGCVAQETWELVPRDSLAAGTNVIPVKWVYKIKTDEHGQIAKFKARITPKGFKQKHGVDFFEVFANTGKYKSLRTLLSIAAKQDLELRQLDVPQAFTQAGLKETVYMEMPAGFEQPGMVCRLKKSLYGLKQSPRNWYQLISKFIKKKLGFRACVSDPCLFTKRSRTGKQILLFLFVDDMQVAFDAADASEWAEAQQQLKDRFNITDLGESRLMLGMRIQRDRRARTLTLDQELYISKALEKFGLSECRQQRTPASAAACEPDAQPTDEKLYQEKVGTLLYAAISTRPDIAFAVNKLTQRMQSPTAADAKACDRVFRYLAGTRSMGLLFGRHPAESDMSVTAYADADWGNDKSDRKSITGWITFLGGDPVSWASKKQKVVAQSTCEAELYAEAAAINETKWLAGLLDELGLSSDAPPVVLGDNQSAQQMSKNDVKSERTKHIDIKYHFITDEVTSGRVELQWVPTDEQLADILTKPLAKLQHARLREQLMVETTVSRAAEAPQQQLQ